MNCDFCWWENRRRAAAQQGRWKACDRHISHLWAMHALEHGITTRFPRWIPDFMRNRERNKAA
jgi:hypothetical protein